MQIKIKLTVLDKCRKSFAPRSHYVYKSSLISAIRLMTMGWEINPIEDNLFYVPASMGIDNESIMKI